jgi:hypothetical protein
MYSSKKSREYILLSTFEHKTAFSVIYEPKSALNRQFFDVLYILGGMGVYLTPLTLPPVPLPGHSPHQ